MPSFVVALFLVAHGLIHTSFLRSSPPPTPGAPAWPFHLDRSRVMTPLGVGAGTSRAIGIALIVVVVAGYVAAAVAALGLVPALFVPGVVAGSVASMVLLVLFFHPWFVLGLAIDVLLLWAVLVNGWHAAAGGL